MYFHPLQEEIGNMSEEEISKRIKELSRKVAIAGVVVILRCWPTYNMHYEHIKMPSDSDGSKSGTRTTRS